MGTLDIDQTDERPLRLRMADRIAHMLELPLALAAVVLVLLAIIELTGQVGPRWQPVLTGIQTVLWGFFVFQYALRLMLAPRKFQYVKSHPFDTLVVALPFLAVLRIAFLLQTVRLAPVLRILVLGGAGLNAPLVLLRRRRLGQLILISALVVLIGASLGYLLERGAPHTQMHTFGDSLWWSATLIATFGSNVYAVTGPGRFLSFALMLYGVGVFSYITASVASLLVGIDRQMEERKEAAEQARRTHEEIQQLRVALESVLQSRTESQDPSSASQ